MKKLIRRICELEGKKSQTSIANVRETIAVLMDVLAEDIEMTSDHVLTHEFNAALNKRIARLQKKKAKAKK